MGWVGLGGLWPGGSGALRLQLRGEVWAAHQGLSVRHMLGIWRRRLCSGLPHPQAGAETKIQVQVVSWEKIPGSIARGVEGSPDGSVTECATAVGYWGAVLWAGLRATWNTHLRTAPKG